MVEVTVLSYDSWEDEVRFRYGCLLEFRESGDKVKAYGFFKNCTMYIGVFYVQEGYGLVYDKRKEIRS